MSIKQTTAAQKLIEAEEAYLIAHGWVKWAGAGSRWMNKKLPNWVQPRDILFRENALAIQKRYSNFEHH